MCLRTLSPIVIGFLTLLLPSVRAAEPTDWLHQARWGVMTHYLGAPPSSRGGAELLQAVDAAVKLTGEQKESMAKLQKERADLFAEIQKELRSLLTDEQRKQLRPQGRSRGPAQPPLTSTGSRGSSSTSARISS